METLTATLKTMDGEVIAEGVELHWQIRKVPLDPRMSLEGYFLGLYVDPGPYKFEGGHGEHGVIIIGQVRRRGEDIEAQFASAGPFVWLPSVEVMR